jgi:hypothetical protein
MGELGVFPISPTNVSQVGRNVRQCVQYGEKNSMNLGSKKIQKHHGKLHKQIADQIPVAIVEWKLSGSSDVAVYSVAV